MNTRQKHQLINVARSYERIIAEKRLIFLRVIDHKKNCLHNECEAAKRAFWECGERAKDAERLLAKCICRHQTNDIVCIDEVIYVTYPNNKILRIPLGDIPDLAKEIDRVGSTM